MSLDLSLDDTQAGVVTALEAFCREQWDARSSEAQSGAFPAERWAELAEFGFFAARTREGEAGALEVVVAMETLGAAAFPGPLAGTFLATPLLAESERDEVVAGRSIVSAGSGRIYPYAPAADVFLEIDAGAVYRVEPVGDVSVRDTIGGERWGEMRVERREEFPRAEAALALYRTALAAYFVGAGSAILAGAVEHASGRKQFGRAIGEFQAVAHPLADSHVRLEAARLLARSAAERIEKESDQASGEACAAHFSARRAAVEAAHVSHQVYGAVGITLEGPAFHLSRRIMQSAALPPTAASDAAALYAGGGSGTLFEPLDPRGRAS